MEPKSEQKLKTDRGKEKTRTEEKTRTGKQRLGVLKENNADEKVNRIFYIT